MKTRTAQFVTLLVRPLRRPAAGLYLAALLATPPAVFGQTPAPTPEQKIVLEPFKVNASSNVGYGALTTSSAGRVVQNYIDVPQTVNVITSQFMQDFDLTDSRSALATVPGVQVGSSLNNGTNAIRGVLVNAYYIDGMQGSAGNTVVSTSGAIGSVVMPTVFYDRIEVVKGPTSAAFGIGESAGLINYIPKTPQGIDLITGTIGIGDHNNYMGSIDAQGKVNGQFGYRLVLDYESGNTPVWFQSKRTAAAQLALKYEPNRDTTIQWITSYENFEQPASAVLRQFKDHPSAVEQGTIVDPGFVYNPANYPTTGGIPPGLPFGLLAKENPGYPPGWESDVTQAFRTELSLVHNFSDRVSVRNAFVIDNSQMQQHLIAGTFTPLTPYNPDGSTFGLSPGEYGVGLVVIDWPIRSRGVRDAFDFNASCDMLGGHYVTTAGAEIYQTWNWENFQIALAANAAGKTIYENPYNPGKVGSLAHYVDLVGHDKFFSIQGPWDSETNKGYGFYVQEEASYFQDRLKLLGAFRKDFLIQTDTSIPSGAVTSTGWSHSKGAPRLAATFKPLKWLSIYAMYSEHNDPMKQTSKWIIEGNPSAIPASVIPDPTALIQYQPQGKLTEEGIKASLLNGQVIASAAFFHDTTKGSILGIATPGYTPTSGPFAGVNQAYAEQIVSGTDFHGIEVSVTGTVMDRLTFTAAYSHIYGTQPAEYTGVNMNGPYSVFRQDKLTDPDILNFFGKYEFGDRKGDGLFVTFGVNAYGPMDIMQNPVNKVDWAGNFHHYGIDYWQYEADAGIGYHWGLRKQKLYLTCSNLTDQYIDIGSGGSQNTGEIVGRQFWLKYSITY